MPLFILAHFSHHLVLALPAPLLPFIRDDFALDYTRAGLVMSALHVPNGASQLLGGWLAGHIDPRILITIGISGVALAGLLVGVSQTYIMLIVFLVLMGMMGGGYHPAAPPLLLASVNPKKQGRVLGLHAIGGSPSYFLAPLIAVAMATEWGWRSPFIGLAIPTIVFGIILYRLLGRKTAAKKVEHASSSSHTEISRSQGHLRRLVSFLILATFTSAVVFSLASFIPLFMVDHFGASNKMAAIFLALLFSAGMWAAPLGGYLADRFGSVPVMLAVGFIAGPLIYLLTLAPYGLAIGALLVAIGMLTYIRMPVAENYIINHTPERHRSLILGIYYFGSIEGSGVLTPVIGYLIDQFGFYNSFTIMGAAMLAVTIGCSIFLWGSRD